jgi:hypothetical protein
MAVEISPETVIEASSATTPTTTEARDRRGSHLRERLHDRLVRVSQKPEETPVRGGHERPGAVDRLGGSTPPYLDQHRHCLAREKGSSTEF